MQDGLNFSPFVSVYPGSDSRDVILFNHLYRGGISVHGSACSGVFPLQGLGPEERERMRRLDYFEDPLVDPYTVYLNRRHEFLSKFQVVDAIIHLNYDCNLACGYCYQSAIRGSRALDESGLLRVIDFIRGVSSESGDQKPVYWTLIGGEPTLHPELLDRFVREIGVSKLRVAGGQVVSNGVRVDAEIVRQLARVGVDEWMITLDGLKGHHDHSRPLVDGSGSFEYIADSIRALDELLPAGKLHVNMNLYPENANDVEPLCAWLRSWGFCGSLTFSWVFVAKEATFTEVLAKKDTVWRDAVRVAERYGFIDEAFSRASYMGCAMFSPSTYIIGADEWLYSCINAVGDPRYKVAPIRDACQADFESRRRIWLERDPHRSCCRSCRFVARCGGGCTYQNDLNGFDCPKKSLELNEEAILKDHLRRGLRR